MRVYMDIIADKFWVVYRSLSQNFDLNLAVMFLGTFKSPPGQKSRHLTAPAFFGVPEVRFNWKVSARFMRRELCEKPV